MVIGIGIGISFSGQKGQKVRQNFPIEMAAGLMDFSITNAVGVLWSFPDGTTSTADRPAKTLAEAGTVFLDCDDFTKADIEIKDNNTNTDYIGDLSDFPPFTYAASFSNTAVTGDISALSNLTYYASFGSTDVTGILDPHPSLSILYLNNTNLSTNDTDQTVINLDTNTTATGTRALNISGLNRTSASTSAVNSLLAKGWSVADGTVV